MTIQDMKPLSVAFDMRYTENRPRGVHSLAASIITINLQVLMGETLSHMRNNLKLDNTMTIYASDINGCGMLGLTTTNYTCQQTSPDGYEFEKDKLFVPTCNVEAIDRWEAQYEVPAGYYLPYPMDIIEKDTLNAWGRKRVLALMSKWCMSNEVQQLEKALDTIIDEDDTDVRSVQLVACILMRMFDTALEKKS